MIESSLSVFEICVVVERLGVGVKIVVDVDVLAQ